MSVIRTEALTRTFGPLTAVDALSVEVPREGVIGLVGPNGSGKSTLIRMLLGLIRPASGTATVLDFPINHPAAYADRVGALIENPAFIPGMSARANLQSLARLRGIGDDRVTAVLAQVGLVGRESDRVSSYSLGMKQRLGIAAALLPDPDLLVLDEPTNGLDPAGIVEIRQLLKALAAEGRTVIVSSHLLSEIQAACDFLIVIRFGELMFSGPLAELMEQTREHLEVAPENDEDVARLIGVLNAAGWPAERPDPAGAVWIEGSAAESARVNRAAAEAGITLKMLVTREQSLEEIFLAMTGVDDGELAGDRARQQPKAQNGGAA